MDWKETFGTGDVIAACREQITGQDLANWRRLRLLLVPGVSRGRERTFTLAQVYEIRVVLELVRRGMPLRQAARVFPHRTREMPSAQSAQGGWSGGFAEQLAVDPPVEFTDRDRRKPWFWVLYVDFDQRPAYGPVLNAVVSTNDPKRLHKALQQARYVAVVLNLTEILRDVDEVLRERIKRRRSEK